MALIRIGWWRFLEECMIFSTDFTYAIHYDTDSWRVKNEKKKKNDQKTIYPNCIYPDLKVTSLSPTDYWKGK